MAQLSLGDEHFGGTFQRVEGCDGHPHFRLEASVPLRALHLDASRTPTIRGDVGRVLSDQTGTRAAARSYWSNKNTNIVSDVPSEARLQPSLWGELRFEGVDRE